MDFILVSIIILSVRKKCIQLFFFFWIKEMDVVLSFHGLFDSFFRTVMEP